MRIAVVSDIHGNLPALDAVIDDIARERVDRVVNLGDIVSGPLWPRETAARLRGLAWPGRRSAATTNGSCWPRRPKAWALRTPLRGHG